MTIKLNNILSLLHYRFLICLKQTYTT